MRAAGRAAAEILDELGQLVAAGITTHELDQAARQLMDARGVSSSQFGYHGFPGHICTSVNEVVCHGIPDDRILRNGDIINIDVTVACDGFHGDTSRTFAVGDIDEEATSLLSATQDALQSGITAVAPKAHVVDIGKAILHVAKHAGFTVVAEYCGHGIGRQMHMPPQIPHRPARRRGPQLRPGMAFTIEPMLNVGTAKTWVLSDGWTVITGDHKRSAQFEHTLIVTETGAEITTLPPET